MTSRFLVRGEQGVLELILRGEIAPDEMPEIPEVANLSIRPLGMGLQRRAGQGRRPEYFLPFVVSSYDPGNYVIPPIALSFGGETHRTEPIELRVIDETKLQWTQATVGTQRIRYAAAFYALKSAPYVGEKQPVELKVYFPTDQIVLDWGIPDFERDGLSAWRFQPQPRLGRAPLLGRNYHAVPYPSTMSTNRPGKSTLGPATLRLQLQVASVQDFGRAYPQPVTLNIPAITFDSKPLPEGAPDGFDNAIGRFDLQVTAGETEVREGDPITVEITVSGSGNLDALNPPGPIDADGWKLYDATAAERGEERRELAGEVVFRQFMRPLRLQSSLPPFRLVYFDPARGKYDTLLSDAIPLTVLPSTAAGISAGPPQALPIPLEAMTDILGVVNPAPSPRADSQPRFARWWHLLPALIVAVLLGRIAYGKLAPRLRKDPDTAARQREWRDVERAPDQAAAFYRKLGHFIERWLGDHQDPVVVEVLQRRDQLCFRADGPDQRIDRSERQRILRQLRRIALPLLLALAVLVPAPSHAAEEPGRLYEEGRYAEAARLWLESGPYDQLSADSLFNIGNAAYRLGNPGEAALYYRRALERDSAHPEARQNLRFLERKFGAITIKRPDYQHLLARYSLGFWQSLLWASLWLATISFLIFPATRTGSSLRIAGIFGWVTAPLLAAAGAIAWHYYPDDARFAPLREQMVIVADSAEVRTAAARTAPKVIDAPAGSLCRLVTRSGDWAYIAFTNESRGWVPLVDIQPILPETTPAPPAPRPTGTPESDA